MLISVLAATAFVLLSPPTGDDWWTRVPPDVGLPHVYYEMMGIDIKNLTDDNADEMFAFGVPDVEQALYEAQAADVPALALLLRTQKVAGWAVGFAGTASTGVEAFERLSRRPDAEAIFTYLRHHGTAASLIYAAAGLHELDPDSTRQIQTELRARNESVTMNLVGCVAEQRPAAEVADVLHQIIAELRSGLDD